MEIWKSIKGYEDLYEISNLGKVKSLWFGKENILRTSLSKGYKKVGLSKDSKMKTFRIHQLLAIAFLSHEPSNHNIVVDHKDNDRLNNSLSNLQLITNRENITKNNKKGSSEYVGVGLRKRDGAWISRIQIDGKRKNLGRFTNELEASNAYQIALKGITNK